MYSLAFVTVCPAIMCSRNGRTDSFIVETAGFGNVVTKDWRFAPISTVAQWGTRFGSLTAVARLNFVSPVLQALSVVKSIRSFMVGYGKWHI